VSERVGILRVHVERQRHGDTVAHGRGRRAPHYIGDQVQRAETVVISPPAPVRQRLEVANHLCVLHLACHPATRFSSNPYGAAGPAVS
jgi:hypothetical protein